MSISGISSSSSALIENALEATLAASNQQSATTTTATASNTASQATTASNPADALTQDVLKLLKALASGNTTQAKSDLVKLKTDLKADTATQTSNSDTSVSKDVTTLLKNLTGGNDTAEQNAVEAQSSQTSSTPLDSLVGKLTDALNSGSVQGALQDLTKYLVQNGQSSGGLVNTSA